MMTGRSQDRPEPAFPLASKHGPMMDEAANATAHPSNHDEIRRLNSDQNLRKLVVGKKLKVAVQKG